MKTRSLIVDDNEFNLEVLADLISASNYSIEIVGKAKNGAQAISMINMLKPELVFLDVEMPDMNGFDVLAKIDKIDFQTIFVTAHSHYAIQAIRFNALDYLVKPLNENELTSALKRFYAQGHANRNQQTVRVALSNRNEDVLDQILFLPTQEGGIKMVIRDIIKIEGDRNYSTFYLTKGKTKISSKTLGYFEEILKSKGFFRSHRSVIINKHHISNLQKDVFILKDGSQVPISRRRKSDAKTWFISL